MEDQERYLFLLPGIEQYDVVQTREGIKKAFGASINGTVTVPLEKVREIVTMNLGGIPTVVMGEGIHSPLYNIRVVNTVGDREFDDVVHVHLYRKPSVGVTNEETKS